MNSETTDTVSMRDEAQRKAGEYTDKARATAAEVKDQTQAKASELTNEIKDKAGDYVEQAKAQAGSLMAEARDTATERASEAKGRTASQLSGVASALRRAGEDLKDQDATAPVGDYAAQAAARLERFSGHLQEADVKELLGEVEDLGRREPALFLGGAFALGVIAARFLKSSSHERRYNPNPRSGNGYSGTGNYGQQSSGYGSRYGTYNSDREDTRALPESDRTSAGSAYSGLAGDSVNSPDGNAVAPGTPAPSEVSTQPAQPDDSSTSNLSTSTTEAA